MKTLISHSFINLIGKIWMPNQIAAQTIDLTENDIENLTDDENNVTKQSVENWLCSHTGDFSTIIDFYADIETGKDLSTIIDWEDEESEMLFNECMYSIED